MRGYLIGRSKSFLVRPSLKKFADTLRSRRETETSLNDRFGRYRMSHSRHLRKFVIEPRSSIGGHGESWRGTWGCF